MFKTNCSNSRASLFQPAANSPSPPFSASSTPVPRLESKETLSRDYELIFAIWLYMTTTFLAFSFHSLVWKDGHWSRKEERVIRNWWVAKKGGNENVKKKFLVYFDEIPPNFVYRKNCLIISIFARIFGKIIQLFMFLQK